jgi:hypothetical protein
VPTPTFAWQNDASQLTFRKTGALKTHIATGALSATEKRALEPFTTLLPASVIATKGWRENTTPPELFGGCCSSNIFEGWPVTIEIQ